MNTKYLKISAALLFGAGLVASCSDLDVDELGAYASSEQKSETVAQNPERVEATVNATFSAFSVYNQMNGSRSNDFGYGSIMLALDHRGQDLVGLDVGYNWFNYYEDYEDIDYSYYMVNYIWTPLYKQIKSANDVLAIVPETVTSDDMKFYRAQALAARAFEYFNLAQLFQYTYVGHESAPCVPVITDKNADEAGANGCARNTVQEVYDQILADLAEAETLLNGNTVKRADKRFADINVVKAIRARVYLVMNKWAEAAADAQYVIANSGAVPYSIDEASHPGFVDLSESNIIWGIKIAETDRVVTSWIVNFPSHMGSLNYGYASAGAWRLINKALYNSIPATDARKNWFLDEDGKSKGLTADQQAWISAKEAPAYTQVKFAPYGGNVASALNTSTNATDIPLIRVEEMYLILAEAQANGAGGDGAATLTNFVKTYRDPSFSVSGSLTEAIWQQRRVEFWGEGLSYFDLQRLKKPVDRVGGGFPKNYVFQIAWDDPARIYPIPQSEIQANALISDADNNPTATLPKPVADN